MNCSKLDSELEDIINSYSSEIRSKYKEGSNNPVTEDDINELARQTFYTLADFKNAIVEFLKKN